MASTLLNQKELSSNACYKHAFVKGILRQNIAALNQLVSQSHFKINDSCELKISLHEYYSILTGGKGLGRGSGFAKFSY
jgi:hypothetical protein